VNVLFVLPYTPVPPDAGNKNLTYGLLKHLDAHVNCDVLMLVEPHVGAPEDVVQRFRAQFPRVGTVRVFHKPVGWSRLLARARMALRGYHPALGTYQNEALWRWLGQAVRPGAYDLVHFDMFLTAWYRRAIGHQPAVLVASDAYAMAADNARRESTSGFWHRAKIWLDAWMFRRFETREYPGFKVVCTVSDRDRAYLAQQVPDARFQTIGIAVSAEFAERPIAHFADLEPGRPPRLLITGTLSHPVVAQGCVDFLQASLPRLRALHPGMEVTVLGKDPAPTLAACMAQLSGVTHVSFAQDYAGFLDQDWVYVYPQRCGSGLQTKLQQAMALGLPVVGYDVSFGGLRVVSGEQAYVCQSAQALEQAVIGLYAQPDLRRRVGRAAATHIRQGFSVGAIGEQMLAIYRQVLDQGEQRS